MSDMEKMLDSFKRYSQQAGIAQQKATVEGSRDETRGWLDKAEAKREEILALHGRLIAEGLASLVFTPSGDTTTHPIIRDYSTPEGRETWEAVAIAAAKAPDWLRKEFEARKEEILKYGPRHV